MPLQRKTIAEVTEDLQWSCLARYGLSLTEAFIVGVLCDNPDLLGDMQSLGVDTSNREAFIGLVSVEIGCGRWPGGTAPDSQWEAFKAMLRVRLPEFGQRYVEVEDRPRSPWSG